MKNTEPENIGKHLYAVRNYAYIYIYIYIYIRPHLLVIFLSLRFVMFHLCCHLSVQFLALFFCLLSFFFGGLDRGLRPKMVSL